MHLVCRRSLLKTLIVLSCVFPLLINPLLVSSSLSKERGLYRFLRSEMEFTDDNIEEMHNGGIVTKAIRTDTMQEIMVISVARIKAPKEFYLDIFQKDGMNLETAAAYEKGTFSSPPQSSDVAKLTFPDEDIRELANCEVGLCKVKMTARGIKAYNKLDQKAPDFIEKANGIVRRAFVRYVRRYLKGGNKALAEYNDKTNPTSIAEEFQDLLKKSHYIFEYIPKLHAYLEDFPKKKLPNSTSVIYWMKEDFERAKQPIVSINHMVFSKTPKKRATVIASKQLYASHYFEAALRLTAVIKDSRENDPGFYLVYIDRSRLDLFRTIPSFFKKQFEDGARDLVHKRMIMVKKNVEKLYQSQ